MSGILKYCMFKYTFIGRNRFYFLSLNIKYKIQNATTTSRLFAEANPGPFSMEAGGTISIDVTSTKLVDVNDKTCPHISSIYHLEIYVVNDNEFGSIDNGDSYTEYHCYDEYGSNFNVQNCWYYKKATKKFFIPINSTLTTVNTINYASSYHILIVNPCKITYKINVN